MSLFINNFSMDLGESIHCVSLVDFSMDITDDVYTVTSSGIYITDNNINVPYNLTPILEGYNLHYITTPSGNIDLKVYASNSNNDTLSRLYSLQYGYEFKWEKVVIWEPLQEVPIAVVASNTATAKNTAYFSTFFITKDFSVINLGAEITAEGSGIKDLLCYITPQSKYFMYSKTYSIIIEGVKDFSGNILPKQTYSFTIEDNNQL